MKTKIQSFTLIELLVVIVIIGILSGLVVIATSSFIEKADFSKAQAFSSTSRSELLSNLVSEWLFDDPAKLGGDTWGNNHGTGTVGAQTSNCVYRDCISLNGTNQYISIPLSSSLQQTTAITFSVWADATDWSSNTAQRLLSCEGTNKGYGISAGSANVSDKSVTYDVSLKKGWHFFLATYGGGELKAYIDGKEVGTKATGVNNITYDASNLIIGAKPGLANYFKGSIDDIRLYDKKLSLAEIRQNYIAGLDSLLANGVISRGEYNGKIEDLALN